MAGESVRVGENRWRERFGRHFEDFEVAETYEHRPGRTISEAGNTWFTLLTMNTHLVHFDAEYAKHTEFGRPPVVSTPTLSLLVGMSVSNTSQKAKSTVLRKRESKSRPDQGIVSIRMLGRNQQSEVVCEFERTMLVMRRGNALEQLAGY